MKYKELKDKFFRNFGKVEVERKYKIIGGDDIDFDEVEVEDLEKWIIQLPHSCDEWEIGDVQKTKEMIENLKKAIEFCEAF